MERIKGDFRRLVEQLLAGSERINEMRREIDCLISMILGLLTEEDFSRLKYQETICAFKFAGLWWRIQKSKHCVSLYIFDEERSDTSYIYTRGSDISLGYVQRIHQGLPGFLKIMITRFPRLEERFIPLLEAVNT